MQYRFMRFPGGKGKAFTMSYDDGCEHDIRFSDVITKYGLKCTFNLTSMERIALSAKEVKEHILSRGHEVAVHGAMHLSQGKIRPIEGICDILESRKSLEEEFKIIVRGMAYANTGIREIIPGNTYENIKGYIKNLDIAYARTLGGDNNFFNLPEDWYSWMPTAHHNNPMLMEYIDEFLDLSFTGYYNRRNSRLFYLWGHSYEFEENDNWSRLDDICEKISGRDDIWYATNMEIYEYVKAYNSLIYSADGKIVRNPSRVDIWFECDDKTYKVTAGQTIFYRLKKWA